MAINIYVFVPAFGQQITAATFLTTHALQQTLSSKGIGGGISTLSFPDIAELRGMALTMWYDTMPHVSHMLFVDSDMAFPPDLVLDMLMFDEPLVGTIYRQRKPELGWAGSGNGQPVTERRGNFMKVEGVGMGCTLIRRDLITAMLEKMPEIVDTRLALHPAGETMRSAGATRLIRAFEKLDIPDRGIVSEDLSFCIRAAHCGIPTWAAVGHKISHVGPYDYQGRYLDIVEQLQRNQIIAEMAQHAGAKLQAPVDPPAPAKPWSDAITVTDGVVAEGWPIYTGSAEEREVIEHVVNNHPKRHRGKPWASKASAAKSRNGRGLGR